MTLTPSVCARWIFTPREPWRAGSYQLLALDILEDIAANQIGRAFEVDNFESACLRQSQL
jgi:hypothetical protein